MEKTSILLDDKNKHYALVSKVIRTVKDKYDNKFKVSDITSLEEFTITEKQYLKIIFSPDITGLYAWEHHFYFIGNMWHYDESDQYDYRKTIRYILLLLNKGSIPIGETVKTNDYRFVKSIYDDWFNLLDCESQRLYKIAKEILYYLFPRTLKTGLVTRAFIILNSLNPLWRQKKIIM